ncbi:hypothetical protein ACFL6C_04030 [Myxococcota bacterium]
MNLLLDTSLSIMDNSDPRSVHDTVRGSQIKQRVNYEFVLMSLPDDIKQHVPEREGCKILWNSRLHRLESYDRAYEGPDCCRNQIIARDSRRLIRRIDFEPARILRRRNLTKAC